MFRRNATDDKSSRGDMAPASPVDTAVLDTELHPGWHEAMPRHIPEPTYWPVTLALGVTLLVWGIISSPLLWIPGIILFAVALGGWIGEMLHDHGEH